MLDVSMTVSEAADVLGVKPRTLQSWVPFIPEGEVPGGGVRGKHRIFTLQPITLAATAIELMTLGVGASRAFEAARGFAYTGEAATEDCPPRADGFPYHPREGETFLYVSQAHNTVRLHPALSQADLRSVLAALSDPPSFIALNVSRLFIGLVDRLGLTPDDVFKAAYPE